jgi:hypothetical protein
MGSVIGPLESLGGHMGVDLRGGQAGMPQEGLHAAQVGTVVEEMRGKGVAELVWTQRGGKPCLPDIGLEQEPDRAMPKPLAALVEKERACLDMCLMAVM